MKLPDKFISLNAHSIAKELLAKELSLSFNLHVLTSIDSTNSFLKKIRTSNQLEVCCAEMQTEGRGRFGRHWHSPFGENIYCSSRWHFNCELTNLSGLSLITSLAIVSTLKQFNLPSEIKVKWPNDIYWTDKKLCGNLVEILEHSNGTVQVIIGIGLNVNADTLHNPLPDKPWCSLYEMSNRYFDRNLLIANLIINLELYFNKFFNNGLHIFMDEWNHVDYLAGKNIQVTRATDILIGRACGINHLGQLILEDEAGINHLLSSGEASLQ